MTSERFDELIAEAESQQFAGWDFSYVKDRMVEEPLPWYYLVEVRERLNGVSTLLDLGTGGGEVLSQLAPLPARTFATEEYAPNAPIAARRLHPLGRGWFGMKPRWRTMRRPALRGRTSLACRSV